MPLSPPHTHQAVGFVGRPVHLGDHHSAVGVVLFGQILVGRCERLAVPAPRRVHLKEPRISLLEYLMHSGGNRVVGNAKSSSPRATPPWMGRARSHRRCCRPERHAVGPPISTRPSIRPVLFCGSAAACVLRVLCCWGCSAPPCPLAPACVRVCALSHHFSHGRFAGVGLRRKRSRLLGLQDRLEVAGGDFLRKLGQDI